MGAVVWLVDAILGIYFWILIGQVIMSWLVAFNVVNSGQPFVHRVGYFLWRMTEPVLGPIRRVLGRMFGDMGGIDISPIIALLAVGFLRRALAEIAWGRPFPYS